MVTHDQVPLDLFFRLRVCLNLKCDAMATSDGAAGVLVAQSQKFFAILGLMLRLVGGDASVE